MTMDELLSCRSVLARQCASNARLALRIRSRGGACSSEFWASCRTETATTECSYVADSLSILGSAERLFVYGVNECKE